MQMKAAFLISTLGVGACTAAPPSPPPAAQFAAAATNCINSNQIVGRRTVPGGAVEFEMVGGITYRNQLAQVCPGMDRLGSSAVIETISRGQGAQICRGDQIRVYDPVEVKATGAANSPVCVLGEFVAVAR
jgi:hypothetical protein